MMKRYRVVKKFNGWYKIQVQGHADGRWQDYQQYKYCHVTGEAFKSVPEYFFKRSAIRQARREASQELRELRRSEWTDVVVFGPIP